MEAATAQPELEEPIDGTVAHEAPVSADVVPHEPAPPDAPPPMVTRDIALRPSRDPLVPIDPDQVVASMEAYQAMLPRLLDDSDFQPIGGGKKFVKRSGWRKIARAFNLSIVLVSHRVERDMNDDPIRAEVVVRAIAPNGQCQDGDGYCSVDEERFKEAKGRQKLENDLRATATTRAKSRAIADLVGMGDVSAEEVDHGPAPLQPASEELKALAHNALGYLLEGDEGIVNGLEERLQSQYDGDFPAVVLQAILLTAKAVKDHREAQAA